MREGKRVREGKRARERALESERCSFEGRNISIVTICFVFDNQLDDRSKVGRA